MILKSPPKKNTENSPSLWRCGLNEGVVHEERHGVLDHRANSCCFRGRFVHRAGVFQPTKNVEIYGQDGLGPKS